MPKTPEFTLKAFWPIEPDHYRSPMRVLAEAAVDSLQHIARGHKVTITGPGRWWVSRGCDLPGAGAYHLVLACEVPAKRNKPPERQ